ncbi:MAG TPA: 2-hydroxychromene-2-carboxylate isomerase [Fontimonas sp.]
MPTSNIEFYWDAVSPYTYLAATRIEPLAQRHGATLIWKPVLLGKVLEASGNRPPITVQSKGKYMFRDLTLWSRYYGVPLTMPSVFPTNSITAMRIACGLPAAHCGRWAQATMQAYWGRGQDIGKPELLQELAAGLGLDPQATLALAQEPAVKDQLKLNTEEAVQRGIFGAPAFFVDDTLFWGNDRLDLMDAYLAGKLNG